MALISKKIRLKFFLFVFLFQFFVFFYNSDVLAKNEQIDYRLGEVLLKFKGDEEIYKLKFSVETDVGQIINQYTNFGEIENISPNYLVRATAFPNDPDYLLQWYLNPINAKAAWSKALVVREQEFNSRQSVIAVLDSGVDLNHPDLKGQIWRNKKEIANDQVDNDNNGYTDDITGWDFVEWDNDPNPSFTFGFDESAIKHGTIVASLAAATSHNNQGIAGVSWFSQIMPLRVLDSSGAGDIYTVIQAINYAVSNGADIINMSFIGSHFEANWFSAIRNAYNKNVLVVAAAGNTDPAVNGVNLDLHKYYPVCFDGDNGENFVIGVAAVGKDLKKSSFSNYGSCIDITAPGEDFYAAQVYNPKFSGFSNYYDGYWSGTSLSAPLVSGTLALIKALRPSLTASQIRDFVFEGASDIDQYNAEFKNKLGAGMLDVANAVEVTLGKRVSKEKGGEDNYILVGLGSGSFPQLKILRTDGSVFKEFYAYSPTFNGEVKVAAGDGNGDGQDEVGTGTGSGGGPHVRIFNIEGQLISQFFAADKKLRGGINIAVADINGDNIDEIITGAGKGSEPEVKIFDSQGNLLKKFLAYNQTFRGGVKVAVADFNHDGKNDIVTGAGSGGGPHVRVFSSDGELISQFFAFNKNSRGGVNVAVADLHGDGQPEIIAAIENNAVPEVRVFTYLGSPAGSFFAANPNSLTGVNISAGDVDNDRIAEVITGLGVGGNSEIKIFDLQGKTKFEFFAHTLNYLGGARTAVLRY